MRIFTFLVRIQQMQIFSWRGTLFLWVCLLDLRVPVIITELELHVNIMQLLHSGYGIE